MEEPDARPHERAGDEAAVRDQSVRWDHVNDTREMSLLRPVNILLLRRRLGLAIGSVSFAITVVLSIMLGRSYTAQSRFLPLGSEEGSSRLAGIAAQFGVSVGSDAPGASLGFYRELLGTRELLREAVLTLYVFETDPGSGDTIIGTLVDVYDPDQIVLDARIRTVIATLSKNITTTTDPDAGLVTLETTTRWRDLSEKVNRRLLELVNDFNLGKRRSQARAEREFIEQRVAVVRRELEDAESAMQGFLDENRQYQSSPRLSFEAARLQRRVDLQQQVYVALSQSYEDARIQEVRNTPVITVVDRPEGSVRSDLSLTRTVLMGLVVGLVLALLAVFSREYAFGQRREYPDEYAQLANLWKATLADVNLPRYLLHYLRRRPKKRVESVADRHVS